MGRSDVRVNGVCNNKNKKILKKKIIKRYAVNGRRQYKRMKNYGALCHTRPRRTKLTPKTTRRTKVKSRTFRQRAFDALRKQQQNQAMFQPLNQPAVSQDEVYSSPEPPSYEMTSQLPPPRYSEPPPPYRGLSTSVRYANEQVEIMDMPPPPDRNTGNSHQFLIETFMIILGLLVIFGVYMLVKWIF